jgi:uncharacterized protein YjeT (DUF2065 family)
MNESLMLIGLFFMSIGLVILYLSLCGNYGFGTAFDACLFVWFGLGAFVIGLVV